MLEARGRADVSTAPLEALDKPSDVSLFYRQATREPTADLLSVLPSSRIDMMLPTREVVHVSFDEAVFLARRDSQNRPEIAWVPGIPQLSCGTIIRSSFGAGSFKAMAIAVHPLYGRVWRRVAEMTGFDIPFELRCAVRDQFVSLAHAGISGTCFFSMAEGLHGTLLPGVAQRLEVVQDIAASKAIVDLSEVPLVANFGLRRTHFASPDVYDHKLPTILRSVAYIVKDRNTNECGVLWQGGRGINTPSALQDLREGALFPVVDARTRRDSRGYPRSIHHPHIYCGFEYDAVDGQTKTLVRRVHMDEMGFAYQQATVRVSANGWNDYPSFAHSLMQHDFYLARDVLDLMNAVSPRSLPDDVGNLASTFGLPLRELPVRQRYISPLTPLHDIWHPLGVKGGQLKRNKLRRDFESGAAVSKWPLELSAAELLDKLVAAYVHAPDADDIRALNTVLADAQARPPTDKLAFVHGFRDVLTALGLRLKVDGQYYGSLWLAPGKGGQGFIQVAARSPGRTGSRAGGFRNRALEVVSVTGDLLSSFGPAAGSPSKWPLELSAAELLDKLVSAYVHAPDVEDIRALNAVLASAQANPPVDKPAFVQRFRDVVSVLGLRIQVDGQYYGSLWLAPGKGGQGLIQVAARPTNRSSTRAGGFRNRVLQVVADPRNG